MSETEDRRSQLVEQAWKVNQAAYGRLEADGPVVDDSHGPKKSPAAQVWRDSALLFLRLTEGENPEVKELEDILALPSA